jgi:hypothetical protein
MPSIALPQDSSSRLERAGNGKLISLRLNSADDAIQRRFASELSIPDDPDLSRMANLCGEELDREPAPGQEQDDAA